MWKRREISVSSYYVRPHPYRCRSLRCRSCRHQRCSPARTCSGSCHRFACRSCHRCFRQLSRFGHGRSTRATVSLSRPRGGRTHKTCAQITEATRPRKKEKQRKQKKENTFLFSVFCFRLSVFLNRERGPQKEKRKNKEKKEGKHTPGGGASVPAAGVLDHERAAAVWGARHRRRLPRLWKQPIESINTC
jgi:hypothetical protein